MSKSSQTVAFANFNLRFGSALAMLDLWDEIVYPAFFKPLPRETKAGTFYITNTELVKLDGEVFVVGRIVKDTKLRRDQIFQNGTLVASKAEIDAAFSSRFVLRLSTHSLIWAPETRQAPSLASFHATLSKSLGTYWKQHIENTLRVENPNHKRSERIELRLTLMKRFPLPILDVLAYPSEQSVSGFLSKIDVLTEVSYRIVDPNPHYDAENTGAMLLGLKQNLSAKKAAVRLVDKDGLDRDAAVVQITELNSTGIIETKVKGIGPHGEDISGDSESMQVKVHVDQLPDDNVGAAKVLSEALSTQEKAGAFTLGQVTENVRKALRSIVLAYFPVNN